MAANKLCNSLAATLYFLSSKPSFRIQFCGFLTQLELENIIQQHLKPDEPKLAVPYER